ncbi:MAG TPA: signal peptidase II [Longimicrobium sp.]|nr:signal peptidase II [Longimicrobium sp.]
MPMTRHRWLAVALTGVVAADWTSKFLVQNHIRLGGNHTVVDGWLWLAHRENPGMSFSWLRDAPEHVRFPLLVIAAVIGIAVAGWIVAHSRDTLTRAAAGLVIAGAVGNLGDRVMNGAVTDFIFIRFFPFVFNVADVAITAGAILLAYRLYREESRDRGGSTPAPLA